MCTAIEFKEKVDIIKHADLEDAVILKQNYSRIIEDITEQTADKETYIILQKTVEERISELRK
jgi:hypothetical protein